MWWRLDRGTWIIYLCPIPLVIKNRYVCLKIASWYDYESQKRSLGHQENKLNSSLELDLYKKINYVIMKFDRALLVCAQSFQSCPTLCNPMDCCPPGSSIHKMLQARIRSGLPCPPPGDLPDLGIKPASPVYCITGGFFMHWDTWVAIAHLTILKIFARLFICLRYQVPSCYTYCSSIPEKESVKHTNNYQ